MSFSEGMFGVLWKGKIFAEELFGFRVDTPNGLKPSSKQNRNTSKVNMEETATDGNNPAENHNGLQNEDESSKSNLAPSNAISDISIVKGETSCLTISVYSAVLIACICLFLVVGRSYIKYLLLSLEDANIIFSILIFTFLFTVVSFPMTWGYILLNIAAGYLYGVLIGVAIVIFCALTGLTLAHFTTKKCLRNFVISRLSNDSVKAIIRVVESKNGFKVVALSRLTPIPFGLQNALFSISNISFPRYIAASAMGMLPSQGMHAYVGSTLRSMEEVISDGGSSKTAYVIFALQLSMIGVLLLYVVRRAKMEFNKTVHDMEAGGGDQGLPEKQKDLKVNIPDPSSEQLTMRKGNSPKHIKAFFDDETSEFNNNGHIHQFTGNSFKSGHNH